MADNTRISRDDLESKFRALQADIQGRAADKKQSAIAIGSAVASIVVILAYLLGATPVRRIVLARDESMEIRITKNGQHAS